MSGHSVNWCVYFGFQYVMFQADNIEKLKKLFKSNEAQSSVWKWDLSEHEVEIVDKYVREASHDLELIREHAPDRILPDDHVPEPNGQTVYLCVTPMVDFEAHREMLHAEIRADNARIKKEEEEKEAKAAAEKAAKENAKADAKKAAENAAIAA